MSEELTLLTRNVREFLGLSPDANLLVGRKEEKGQWFALLSDEGSLSRSIESESRIRRPW